MEDGFVPVHYNKKVAKAIDILSCIAVILMVPTVILQFFRFNIVLHIALCSTIILLLIACLVCDIIQRDGKKGSTHGSWIFLWVLNIIINLANHFAW